MFRPVVALVQERVLKLHENPVGATVGGAGLVPARVTGENTNGPMANGATTRVAPTRLAPIAYPEGKVVPFFQLLGIFKTRSEDHQWPATLERIANKRCHQSLSLFEVSCDMISLAEIEKVAMLARLSLTSAEAQMMSEQLSKVLEYMSLLNEVNTEQVEPLAHAVELTNVFREDQVTGSLDREEALTNAPHRDAECYLVPAVLGEM